MSFAAASALSAFAEGLLALADEAERRRDFVAAAAYLPPPQATGLEPLDPFPPLDWRRSSGRCGW